MPILFFPDPEAEASPEGIVGVGGDLETETLLQAYSQGIFPWPVNVPDVKDPVLAWFCPPERAILEFSTLHVPRSLAKARKKAEKEGWRFTVDQCFPEVIEACAEPRPDLEEPSGLQGTWITPQMKEAYKILWKKGHAHSVEVWAPTDDGKHHELVGGLYGTCVAGVFAGESMFHRRDNASKFAVLHLVGLLRKQGLSWIDIQVMTDHFEALGAHTLSRKEFLKLLHAEQKLARSCPLR